MSDIRSITLEQVFVYTHDTTLSAPAAAFQILGTSGTLTVTTSTGQFAPMYCLVGVIYNVAFTNISLNGTATGPITAFRAQPFKGTS
jgi:hypothetical protein